MILDGHASQSIDLAAQALRSGDLVGLPTETVYGLAADAGNDKAVAKIFETKGRPSNHPLIVHVASAQSVARFASHVPVFAQKLIDAFWLQWQLVGKILWVCDALRMLWRMRCLSVLKP